MARLRDIVVCWSRWLDLVRVVAILSLGRCFSAFSDALGVVDEVSC